MMLIMCVRRRHFPRAWWPAQKFPPESRAGIEQDSVTTGRTHVGFSGTLGCGAGSAACMFHAQRRRSGAMFLGKAHAAPAINRPGQEKFLHRVILNPGKTFCTSSGSSDGTRQLAWANLSIVASWPPPSTGKPTARTDLGDQRRILNHQAIPRHQPAS